MSYERVFMEINLDYIAHNVRMVRSMVNSDAKLMAVVKADGYGHGAVNVSRRVVEEGVDWLGVAICEEGVALRQAGITCPILILGYNPPTKMEEALDNDLIQTIFSLETAKALSMTAMTKNKIASIHIKIDTGMKRLGFYPNHAAIHEIEEISKLPNIKIDGIYSHFANSDAEDKSFSEEQYAAFTNTVEELKNRGIHTGISHISNSGAILELPQFCCDMVRAGIILYGYSPSQVPGHSLKPAMTLKSHVSQIKQVTADESIGYGRSFFAKKEMTVAVVPVGYADGYSRLLSNKGRVLVAGQFAKIVGFICMDQFMIDISGIKNVSVDDEVVLIGEQGANAISVEEVASLINTINYEIICCIGKRVPRVYKN